MPNEYPLASQVTIKINGTEVQPPVMANLMALSVDQHSLAPAMFTIRLHDTSLELLDKGPFDLTKEIEIGAETSDGKVVVLMKGEITALEPEFREGMVAELVVRGYDKLHRLYRETRSQAFLNTKDSDLANQVAQALGLQAKVDPTSTVYDHIFQHNQSDLAFLGQRAWRIGYECFVDDGTLYFRKPPAGPAGITLTWGSDLLSFLPRMTLAEQVDEVVVKGWDVEKQEAITGKAQKGSLYPGIGEAKDGAGWAHTFGAGRLVIVDQPVISQAEADALASARLDELSGAFIEAEGTAFRRPDIRAGQVIKLEGLGARFSGAYLVTRATHVFTPEGLKTTFAVSGARTGMLSEQASGSADPLDRWPGVVIGVVTNTDDPKNWGRVKVKFPWISSDVESDWARVLGIGAGPQAGLFVMPDVGDEVIVVFEHGIFSRPCVLGGFWNGVNQPPDEARKAGNGEKPLVRTWHSRKGHWMAMFDNAEKKIEIVSSDGRKLTLDDKNKKITLKTQQVEVTLEDNKLSLQSGGDISIKASSNLKLEATGNIDIQANGQVTVKGNPINLN